MGNGGLLDILSSLYGASNAGQTMTGGGSGGLLFANPSSEFGSTVNNPGVAGEFGGGPWVGLNISNGNIPESIYPQSGAYGLDTSTLSQASGSGQDLLKAKQLMSLFGAGAGMQKAQQPQQAPAPAPVGGGGGIYRPQAQSIAQLLQRYRGA